MTHQPPLPGFEHLLPEGYVCPLCGQPATLFGQFAPFLPWGVCRECSIQYAYPIEVFVPSTRRNRAENPTMIDPNAPYEMREKRMLLDEMLKCAVDPTRLQRPIVKYNLSALELRNPIRRSRRAQIERASRKARIAVKYDRQAAIPFCKRCGCVHDRRLDYTYASYCQRCEDEFTVETFWRHRAIFGSDDVESILDRIQVSHPGLFERGVMPDYWFDLVHKNLQQR